MSPVIIQGLKYTGAFVALTVVSYTVNVLLRELEKEIRGEKPPNGSMGHDDLGKYVREDPHVIQELRGIRKEQENIALSLGKIAESVDPLGSFSAETRAFLQKVESGGINLDKVLKDGAALI